MHQTEPVEPRSAEGDVRRRWHDAGLPRASGALGPDDGPLVLQVLGSFAPGDSVARVATRAVRADVDARYLALSGHRVRGSHRPVGHTAEPDLGAIGSALDELGVWAGGSGGRPFDGSERHGRVQLLLERLGHQRVLALKGGAVRLCPHCAAPRSPERTVYQEKIGDTFLVRFPLGGDGPVADALAWVDVPWRLLGASALLVNPDLSYVVAEYRRDGSKARLLLSRSSLARLGEWIAGARFEVVEELKGRELAGRPFLHPLRHEFPPAADMAPPSGTVQAVLDVGDSGTGIVPLVPAHGGSDQLIADRLGVAGPSLLTLDGHLRDEPVHKYGGLELETANDFVLRDLTEAGSVLARLRVLRGVPYCDVCGRAMVWVPGRAWRLELGRLPHDVSARYPKLLPGEPPMSQLELTPWPVSETEGSDRPDAYRLSECDRCDRLEPPDAPAECRCGGHRTTVARRLLPSFGGAIAAWAARETGEAETETRLYLPARRRAPALVHHLAALASLDAEVKDVRLTLVPTVPETDLLALAHREGADAVRAAITAAEHGVVAPSALEERAQQDRRRFGRLLALARALVASPAPAAARGTDEAEDRAFLARWWETERDAVAAYENDRPSVALKSLVKFVDADLEFYLKLVRSGGEPGPEPTAVRAGAAATLRQVLGRFAAAVAPVVPFVAEAIARTVAPDNPSLFSGTPLAVDTPPVDPDLLARWKEWGAVLHAIRRFRQEHRIPAEVALPRVGVVVEEEATAARLRTDLRLLERLARVTSLELGSPGAPWAGRVQRVVPVEDEVVKAYAAIAPQVLHLLRRLPPRGAGGADAPRDVSVVVAGLPRPIPPTMFKVTEELPPGVVRAPFALGELFVQPPGGPGPEPAGSLGLSYDAAWLVRRIHQRLVAARRETEAEGSPADVLVFAADPLASEVARAADALASALGVRSVRVAVGAPPEGRPGRLRGRTTTGARWWADLDGVRVPPTTRKLRGARPGRRVAITAAREPPPAETVDILDPQVVQQQDAVRALADGLEGLLAAPVVGPTKARIAWEAGLRTVDEVLAAPFERVESLPGFGRPVAVVLSQRSGKAVPKLVGPYFGVATSSRSYGTPPLPVSAPSGRATSGPGPGGTPSTEKLGAVETPSVATEKLGTPAAATGGAAERSSAAPAAAGIRTGGVPPPAVPRPAQAVSLPRPGGGVPPVRYGLELCTHTSRTAASLPFLEATAAGHRGVAIVRDAPDLMRTLVGSRPVVVRRLTGLAEEGSVRPSDLAALTAEFARAIEQEGVSAFFVDGVGYLLEIHGLDEILAWLADVDLLARSSEVRVWLHLGGAEITPAQTAAIQSRFTSETELLEEPSGSAGPVYRG